MAGRRLIVTRTPSSPCSVTLFGVRRSGVGDELHQIVAWHQALGRQAPNTGFQSNGLLVLLAQGRRLPNVPVCQRR